MMISSGRTTSAYMREREAYTNSTLAVRKCFSCLPQPLSKCHTHTLPCLSARNTHAHTHIHNHQPTHTHARTSLPPTHTHTHVHTRTHTNHETHPLVGHRTDKTFACHLSNMFLKTTPPKQSVRCKAETETARHAYIYIPCGGPEQRDTHAYITCGGPKQRDMHAYISHVADRNSETSMHISHDRNGTQYPTDHQMLRLRRNRPNQHYKTGKTAGSIY